MSNLRDNKTEEEWDDLVAEAEASAANDKAKEQALKDMQKNYSNKELNTSTEYLKMLDKEKNE